MCGCRAELVNRKEEMMKLACEHSEVSVRLDLYASLRMVRNSRCKSGHTRSLRIQSILKCVLIRYAKRAISTEHDPIIINKHRTNWSDHVTMSMVGWSANRTCQAREYIEIGLFIHFSYINCRVKMNRSGDGDSQCPSDVSCDRRKPNSYLDMVMRNEIHILWKFIQETSFGAKVYLLHGSDSVLMVHLGTLMLDAKHFFSFFWWCVTSILSYATTSACIHATQHAAVMNDLVFSVWCNWKSNSIKSPSIWWHLDLGDGSMLVYVYFGPISAPSRECVQMAPIFIATIMYIRCQNVSWGASSHRNLFLSYLRLPYLIRSSALE